MNKEKDFNTKVITATIATSSVLAIGFLFSRYKVARPSEYLIRTGLGIDGLSITKKGIHWPGQRAMFVDIAPHTFAVDISALSKERIPFLMPSIWTIGPKNDVDSLSKYSTLLMDKGDAGLKNIIQGIIQGETRVLTANMKLDDLFSSREQFKIEIEQKINTIVDVLGLKVYNANVAELSDLDSKNKYFEEQKLRALQRVNQDARVAVASAIRDGDIGEKNEQAEGRKKVSELEKDAIIVENTNILGIEESKKNLEVKKALFDQELKIALADSEAKTLMRTFDLQKEVEEKRNLQKTAELRANLFTSASINAEVIIKDAEAKATVAIKEAEAKATAARIIAEAELFSKLKEAEGIKAKLSAEAEGLNSLVNSANGNINGLVQCLIVQKDMLPKLIEEQAKGIQGLNPKINIWNTGTQNNKIGSILDDFFKTSIPLFDQIKDQTGTDIMKLLTNDKNEKINDNKINDNKINDNKTLTIDNKTLHREFIKNNQ